MKQHLTLPRYNDKILEYIYQEKPILDFLQVDSANQWVFIAPTGMKFPFANFEISFSFYRQKCYFVGFNQYMCPYLTGSQIHGSLCCKHICYHISRKKNGKPLQQCATLIDSFLSIFGWYFDQPKNYQIDFLRHILTHVTR